MNAEELRKRFELVIDKYESDYFTESEITRFANMATLSYIKDLYMPYSTDKRANSSLSIDIFESNRHTSQIFSGITEQIAGTVSTAGIIEKSEILALTGKSDYIDVLLVELGSAGSMFSAKYRPLSELGKIFTNFHLQPSSCEPVYFVSDNKIHFYPINLQEFKLIILSYPTTLNLAAGNYVDNELPDFCLEDIVNKMSIISGITMRDAGLNQLTQQVNVS